MLTAVTRFIKKNSMLPAECRVLVGVSGGMDSVALLHLLCLLKDQLGFTVQAAHFNHGIRRESEEEERFVGALCEQLGVTLHTGRADVPAQAAERGVSLEVAAREARHGFFKQVMAETQADRLALAHHRDDQAETVLLRLIRGSGTDGLGAMAPVEETSIIRPLLCVGRDEIHQWCVENNIEWREDQSNADLSIPRNWVRHALMPLIRERLNPSAAAALCRSAELMRVDEQYLSNEAAKTTKLAKDRPDGIVSIAVSSLAALHPALQSRALRMLLKQAGLDRDVEQVNIEDVAALLQDGKTGSRVDLDRGFVALREADVLVIAPHLPQAAVYEPMLLNIPGETTAAGGVFICELLKAVPEDYKSPPRHVQYVDFDAFPKDAVARGRQPGDRFFPLGAPGSRKLKEYLIDKKLSRWGRDAIPLVASGSDVLWVVGQAISDRVRITETTQRVLKITYCSTE
jgi:tRNA(Ile)-lysidine synthase